jgi:hypothetical protein
MTSVLVFGVVGRSKHSHELPFRAGPLGSNSYIRLQLQLCFFFCDEVPQLLSVLAYMDSSSATDLIIVSINGTVTVNQRRQPFPTRRQNLKAL